MKGHVIGSSIHTTCGHPRAGLLLGATIQSAKPENTTNFPSHNMSNDGTINLESYLPRFRLTSFRPGQEDVISTVLSGRDCLCVMPTGGGKSLCYQLPALALDGLTLVVSPLIALMKDQVDQLHELGLPVTFINSTLTLAEQHERLDKMAAGEYSLAYVVPERFRSSRFIEAVTECGVKLLAIDEAHCVSEWGHDFRPDYARLGHFRRKLGHPPTIALTATATDAVRRDIIEQLDLVDPQTFITGFARDNLFYEVRRPASDRGKGEELLRFLQDTPGSGIVYTSTRKRTDEVAAIINSSTNRRAITYHAGMPPDQRHRAQESFMTGQTEIVVATTAFGMGIDKANVRFVVHYNLPGTIEAYYQEAGRAGRDGKQSKCLFLYTASDRFIQEFFIDLAYPGKENAAKVYDYLRSLKKDPIELTQQQIKDSLGLSIGADGVGTCEQLLEGAGVLERLVSSNNHASVRLDSDLPTLVDLLPKQAKTQRRVLQAIENIVGARRDEFVGFSPRDLVMTTELSHNAVVTALRNLNELEPFTYVPPFRGRAIRMISRDQGFQQLDIDFEAIERRRQNEIAKLNRVISFALGANCRQQTILRYFGEQNAPLCGHCDNCVKRGVTEKGSYTFSYDLYDPDGKILKTVRMALSGVARIKKEMSFDCGKTLISQMLSGSGAARMKELKLNKLSTFGLLQHLRQTEVTAIIEGLIAIDLLRQKSLEPGRPVVQLSDIGDEVMRGNTKLEEELPIPAELARKILGPQQGSTDSSSIDVPQAQEASQSPVDEDLLDRLKAWRKQRAAEANMAAYYILQNKTIEEIATCCPDTSQRLLAINGMGPKRVEQYGAELLAIVMGKPDSSDETPSPENTSPENTSLEAHTPTETIQPPEAPPSSVTQPNQPPPDQPSYYWTWRLLMAGFSNAECVEARGLSLDVIVDHALQAIENGHAVNARWFFSAEQLSRFQEVVGLDKAIDPTELARLLPMLPEGTRLEEVLLYQKCR